MNKNCYKTIFSQTRGEMIAVAENVAAAGQASTQNNKAVDLETPVVASEKSLALKVLSFSLMLITGTALINASIGVSHSNVVADSNAAGNQRPTILNSANGTTQVNIQTPSKAGVSVNHYQQFDVNQNGVILNNSRQNTQTQLGGYIQANPWLAGGEAKVIVNQVNGSNPSHLNGYVEVGGRKADVIIANQAGINVDGGGFINAGGVTLSTANPNIQNGQVTGYQVRDGVINITGQGLDASKADYTQLLSRAAQINAGIWAKELTVVAGQNDIEVNPQAGAIQAASGLAGTVPQFAIDTSHLGGMYAGKISLISTEQGVGINNAGQVFASAGHIKISANGELQNSGAVVAENKVDSTPASLNLQAKDLNNNGKILSLGDQRIQAENVNNTGLINSQGLTRIDASQGIQNVGTGQIYGDHIALQAAHLLNAEQQTNGDVKAGTIAARQRLDIAGGKIENREQALIASEGALTVGGQLNANHMAEGSAALLDNASARIQSVGDMYLGVDILTNRNLHFSSSVKEIPETRKDVTAYQGAGSAEILDSSHITGRGSYDSIYLDGQKYEDYTRYIYNQYETQHYVDSSAPAEIISGGTLTLKGQSLTNDKSQILATKGINIEQNEVNNIDAEGEHRVIKTGTSQYHYVGWNTLGTSKRSKWNSVKPYNPADIVTPIKLDVVKYDGAHQGTLNGDTSELSLPLQSLYSVNKENNNRPLIESSDAFTNYKNWLGSDYMLQMFATNPQNMQKRLGDGYYEQKLVNDQIAQLTGQVYLDGYTNFEDQFKALMDSGVSAAKDLNLSVGVKLSEAQIARLTSDMVWLVTETITVDGEKIQVLVPKVYVAVQSGDLNNKGALIAGETVNLKLSGDLNNQGSIAGRQLVSLEANNINNVGGLIQGRDVFATAHTDINNIGGTMTANQILALDAGRDINNITTTIKTENKHGLSEFSAENIGRVAGLYVQDADGQLVANAKNNINLTASDLQSQGSIAIQAGQDLNLSTVNVSRSDLSSAGDKDQILNASSRDVGTQIQAKGNISLQSGANTQIKASTLNSTSGNVVIDAGQNVLIENGRDERSSQLAAHEKGGFSTTDKKIQSSTSQSIATDIQSGGNILINSQTGDIQATHLQAGAKDSIQITANQGNVKLLSDIDTDIKSTETAKKNTIQFKNRQSGYIDEDVAQTQLKAGKNVDINAGKNIELQANDIQAQDNIYIGNKQFERQADGSLKSKDGNALPENVSLTTLETNDQQWDETQKGYRGIAKDLMKVTAVGLAGIEALAPGLKAPKITIGESSSTRTEQRTQTGTDLGANNVYVGSAGQTTLTSSNIDAQNTVLAGKKVTLDAAEEQHKTVTSNSKETVQGLGVKLNKDSIRVGGFVLEDAENTVKTTATTHKSGNINTENLTIQGAEGVDILGQNITATGDTIIDHGRGNLNIGGYENKTTTEEKTHTETISTEVGIRNAYLDAILAVEAVADATKALSKAKDDYSQAQRDYAAGRITKGALDDSKANVAMATANVASAQIAVGAAAASAAASSATYGFTIGANGERIETTTTTNTEQSQWQGSNLDLNNLQLKSEGQDINIQGSRVNATGTTTFDGSKDLNVTAGVEHSKQDSNSKTNSQSVSYTYGGGGSASIGKQTSQSQNESLTHVNSEVVLNRTEGAIDKLNIQGGEVSIADRGNLQVNQIHVESLQDTETSSNSSKGGNIGLGFGSNGKASNISAGYNQSKGSIDSAWVNDTSKLLIGNAQNDADLDAMGVKNITSIGGVIANATKNEDGTLTDHGKLNYSGELALKDIEDHNYNSSSGFNVSTTIGKTTNNKDGEKSKYPNGSTTIGLNSSGQETEQLTKATMGQGTVANASDSTNRDINNTQEITRDQVTGMLDGSVTVDQRLLSKSGRAEIIQEQKELPENFRQSAENIVKQMPEGEYKEKALQSLNNIQAKLYSLPADFEGLEEYGQQVAGELLKNGLEIKEVEKIIDTDNYWYAIQKLSAVQEQLDILSQNGSGIEQILNSELSKEQPIVNSNSLISILAENTDSSLAVKETDLLGFKFLHAAAEISKNIEKISVDSGVDIEKIQLAASVLLGGPVKATAGYIVNQFSGEYIDYATNAVSDHLVKSLYGLSDGLYDDWSRSEKISELKQLGLSDDDFQRSLNYAESLQNAKLGATFIVGIAAETLISGKGKAKNSDEISVKPTVPDYVTRNDHDFSATENYKGKPKAYINDKGDLVAANPEGTGSVQSHIRGGNSENTPYISTSDPAIAIDSKNYGGEQIKIDTKRLQEDIDAGKISGSQIVTHTEVRKELQSKVDAAQAKYDRNPSKKNRDKLRDANKDLNHAIRDGECLIKGCVPSEYIKK
ncbi:MULTISPECIES: hemagglutinin repeat-containing protein [unclassified Acinetobacter]|uniref:two-partner secretion domain-containing protein n=1 Tax=unclassified Acinetobacter TaxID=196816 RepID=UPI0015D3FE5E|nr:MULTISPECIES: hemagglutinin repeat-containing protein [unclassified Acinetobacter]